MLSLVTLEDRFDLICPTARRGAMKGSSNPSEAMPMNVRRQQNLAAGQFVTAVTSPRARRKARGNGRHPPLFPGNVEIARETRADFQR